RHRSAPPSRIRRLPRRARRRARRAARLVGGRRSDRACPMSDVWVVRWDTRRSEAPCVLDAEGQPYAGPGLFRPAAGGVVACDGYLFDRAELELTSPRSGAAAVAGAYERWKEASFERISGGFALAVWDPGRRCLFVARDAMGLHPCFYACAGPVWLVSPSLDA